MSVAHLNGAGDSHRGKESNSDRLRVIVEEPHLRNLFGEFLRHNFCEENLLYWIVVVDFRKKFVVTSSAVASNAPPPANSRSNSKHSPGQAAMERHHDLLINQAYNIYKQFLAAGAPQELNIDHSLRNELSAYLNGVVSQITGKSFSGRVELEHMAQFNATQLQMLISLYERIQTHVFRLMATDSVPKVCFSCLFTLSTARSHHICSSSRPRSSWPSVGSTRWSSTDSITRRRTVATRRTRPGSTRTEKRSAAHT
jgi:hypothetical protein